MSMLELRAVSKVYGAGPAAVPALRDASLSWARAGRARARC
jgi:hypothetical protein